MKALNHTSYTDIWPSFVTVFASSFFSSIQQRPSFSLQSSPFEAASQCVEFVQRD